MVRKMIALLRCTANQVSTDHKLHFQPKNPARAKLAAINNKCSTCPSIYAMHFFVNAIVTHLAVMKSARAIDDADSNLPITRKHKNTIHIVTMSPPVIKHICIL